MRQLRAGRLLAPVLALLMIGGCGADADVRNNAIKVIQPYFAHGTWVFDDAATGLKAEPFVNGVPEMIERLVADIPTARAGFRLTFSAREFPGYELRLDRGEAHAGGYYYRAPATGQRGWLCPALFKYFHDAPAAIYVSADAIGS